MTSLEREWGNPRRDSMLCHVERMGMAWVFSAWHVALWALCPLLTRLRGKSGGQDSGGTVAAGWDCGAASGSRGSSLRGMLLSAPWALSLSALCSLCSALLRRLSVLQEALLQELLLVPCEVGGAAGLGGRRWPEPGRHGVQRAAG
eukprot:CAMPEP_0119129076 /NCGR_PEP_ID=MMETSP1310-20130426/6978_1 /TAXON_ID=464262 /ORGANISM="Genus nov. species nov., Strain RCC2339" /LENGTH=145 /DNA_ID=CAMNT_0007119479 /DNA_START=158 /DNA_END=592 /DNA_ORIENTATION=-